VRSTDLLAHDFSPMERFFIRFVRRTFEPGWADTVIRWCQRSFGARWIHFVGKNLLQVRHLERLPRFEAEQSYILVSNHRSFFDLYVVGSYLLTHGLRHRKLYPVRGNFFYDHPLGFLLNGAISFFAMYPPLFRERHRQAINLSSIQETVRLLKQGGLFVGLHPEGTRNRSPDPYTLLPAHSGVGRIIHQARVPVIPVFVNGLLNDFVKQLKGNFLRNGEPIIAVFGEPLNLDALFEQPGTPRVYRQISERTLEAIQALGWEERAARAEILGAKAMENTVTRSPTGGLT